MSRADAMAWMKSNPVPAWLFFSPEGNEILMRRGSATPVKAFLQFDQYVSSGAYQRASFEDYLAQRGLQEARPRN
jgi:thioredoxin-related protein